MRHPYVSKPLALVLALAFIFPNFGGAGGFSSKPSGAVLGNGPAFAMLQEAGPIVRSSTRNDTSLPLHSVAPIPPRGLPDGTEIPGFKLPRQGVSFSLMPPDPVLQAAIGEGQMPGPILNFPGVGNVNGVLPPDPNGDIGPGHYVQMVNLSFAIWDREGELLYGPADNSTLFEGFGGPCEETNSGDPIVLYDHLADRWLMSQFALPDLYNGPYYQCLAISQTGDPIGAWHRYEFKISDTKLNDYPKFGVWPDGYYMAVNQFTAPFFDWAGQGVVSFEREAMLSGQPARMLYFDLFSLDRNLGGMLPSDLDGPPPNAESPNYFVQVDDDAWGYSPDQLQIWKFEVDWAYPEDSTFTRLATLATSAFDSNMCGYARNCIPQPGGSPLDAIADRLMYRLQYRYFGDHQTLVTNHTVDVDGTDHGGIRWYELRDSGEGWSIHQQGTYAPDDNHRWMGSLAMDRSGNMALGYSLSSETISPSARYTGRKSDDPLGTMPQGEGSIAAGSGSQGHSSGRWGDYSMMAVDPVDGCTFWYTSEYYAADSPSNWMTRIGAFRFPECGAAPGPTSTPTPPGSTPTPTQPGASPTSTNTPPPGNPPDIEVSPVRFEVTLPQGGTRNEELTLRNVGGSPLSFEVSLKDTTGASGVSDAWQPAAFPTGKIEPGLREALLTSADGKGEFLVYLTPQADLADAYTLRGWEDRGEFVYESLWNTAQESQARIVPALEQMMRAGIVSQFRRFYIVNAVSVTGSAEVLDVLAARPDVAYIEAVQEYQIPEPMPGEEWGTTAVEWGVAKIGADRVWSDFNVRGAGIVVANIDTGVMFDHKALSGKYRGTATGSHSYNWFDPQGGTTPSDGVGHGTHTMGTMVGDDGAGNQVGIAPAAQWIAAKGCASYSCSEVDLLASAEWVLAPYPIGGTSKEGDPAKRPHIVNNSWGGGGGDTFYLEAVKAWRAANILPVFSAGNSGPSSGSVGSPADYAQSFGVGATDSGDNIASFSSRGPSKLTNETKPDVSAPGVSVRSAYYDGGYATYSGTSMAAPHVAGCAALVLSASPGMEIGTLEKLLTDHVVDLGENGPDNAYGYGRIDCYGAVSEAKSFWLRVSPTSGSVGAGAQQKLTVTINANGLAEGTYKAEMVLDTNDPDEDPVVVPVTVHVDNAGATQTPSPTAGLTRTPSPTPTASPTAGLTRTPSPTPTASPTAGLTRTPSPTPTASRTASPSRTPSATPTLPLPTGTPSRTPLPTLVPSPTSPPEDRTFHVGDLDGIGVVADAGGWRAQVTITIHDGKHVPLPNTQVMSFWMGGAWGIGSCTTGSMGQCILTSGRIPNFVGVEYFVVLQAAHFDYAYDQQSNHDSDGDSDGTLIRVSAP